MPLKQNVSFETIEHVEEELQWKFLNEIAKLISKVENTIEREVYIEKITKEYDISKEAIYAEVNKLTYKKSGSEKILEKSKPVITHRKVETKEVPQAIKKRENTIISILLTGDLYIFEIIKQNIRKEVQTMEMKNLATELSSNAYPGRGIVIGKTEDGTKAAIAYFIELSRPVSVSAILSAIQPAPIIPIFIID